MLKLSQWKQNNPFDQLTATISSLEGTVSVYPGGIVNNNRLINFLNDKIIELKSLLPFLQNPILWDKEKTDSYKQSNKEEIYSSAIDAIKSQSGGDIGDLLANLMMYCHVNGTDFEEYMNYARRHFETEK